MENKLNKKIIILAAILFFVPFDYIFVKLFSLTSSSPLALILDLIVTLFLYALRITGLVLLYKQKNFFSKGQRNLFYVIFTFWIIYFSIVVLQGLLLPIPAIEIFAVVLIMLSILFYILTIIFFVLIITNGRTKDKIKEKSKTFYKKHHFVITNSLNKFIVLASALFLIIPFELINKQVSPFVSRYVTRIIGFILLFTQYDYFTHKQKILFKVTICSGIIYAISDFYCTVIPHQFNTFNEIGFDFAFMVLAYIITFFGTWILSLILCIILLLSKNNKENNNKEQINKEDINKET